VEDFGLKIHASMAADVFFRLHNDKYTKYLPHRNCSVPASTVSENPRFISGYICKSSIFNFIEKTLGYSLAVFQVPHAIPL
jgi:hypothetical protein